MKAEIKDLFVKALESGEYPQTSGRLVRLDENGNKAGFCCIGVLSELAVMAGVAEWRATPAIRNNLLGIVPKGADNSVTPETHALPPCVAEWAGVTSINQDIVFGPDRQYDTLISLNDQRGYDFLAIAEVVVEKL